MRERENSRVTRGTRGLMLTELNVCMWHTDNMLMPDHVKFPNRKGKEYRYVMIMRVNNGQFGGKSVFFFERGIFFLQQCSN
jgi:hypothetical protein